MRNYLVYNSDGKILKHGTCADSDLALQASSGQFVLEAEFQPNKKVVDGVLVDDEPASSELNIETLRLLRAEREPLLRASDYTQVSDCPLSEEKQAEWKTYRQQLRDLPSVYAEETDISKVVFPDPPS